MLGPPRKAWPQAATGCMLTDVTMAPFNYPTELEAEVATRDGSLVHVRPVRPADSDQLLAFLQALPDEDRYMRFFSLGNDLARTARDQSNVDYVSSLGLLATAGPVQRVVGHALYVPYGDHRAEVAFAIARDFQGRGLATILLGQLAEAASANGIETFEAIVLSENQRMLQVLRESGFPIKTHYDGGRVEVTLPTSLTPAALAQFDQREEIAASSAVRRFLYPRSVAVVGASRHADAVGAAVVRNLVDGGFPGPVYPVNPAASAIHSIAAYASVGDIAGPVDLAVIALPAARVVEAAEECGRKGVQALIVLTAGFNEVGDTGTHRQAELLRICNEYGMRLVGPNCIGVINTDPQASLNATFGPLMSRDGRLGLATQSGAVGLAAIDFTAARDLGFSSVISMGNKADISGNDLLGYWHTDPRTDVIMLYLESFGNPRKFARLARSIGRTKPILALKSGRSAVGARATSSHTGALLAASDVTVDALFRQAGVIRTDTLDDMLDVADLLVHQRLPAGPRVAILTNAGGPAVMCADACEAHGLQVAPLSDSTQDVLRTILPPEASVLNPVDMLAAASSEQYREAVRAIADDPNVDAVISIFLPPLATQPADVARALRSVGIDKPLLGVFMSSGPLPDLGTPDGRRIPGYRTPEPAAMALAQAARYAAWRAQPLEDQPALTGIQRDQAGLLLSAVCGRGGGWLDPDEVRQLLAMYGVPVVDQRLVATAQEAGVAAEELGGGMALKVVAPGLLHKSDAGGVLLHLGDARAVELAATRMSEAVTDATGKTPSGFIVQRMAPPGVEMLVGVVNDPQFGPTIACGAGGTLVELLKDVSVRLTPLTRGDAASMLRELRSFPMLNGYRGAQPSDVGALEDVLLRIGALAEDHPAIAELDCNPVIVSQSGAIVVDARVRVEHVQQRRPIGARR
ncbi:MAG: GNAT family N-acetyltransferase [Chloroflexi bacterium]|nr:GNAT family N-acetyltransferase [Chloroflexota bacterium]